ncbi:MAG TPA: metal ABC transporter ATP-binding protein [Actinomycetota bacterium]|nr:metal ABC transporter ATP-binding protein [Actinomycetota bacterium]
MTVVSARDLAAAYGRRTVWEGATFDLEPGAFVGVLGPNGAGKSTLFRLLLGLLRPAHGSLTVLGEVPHRGDPAIGYVPQRRPVDAEVRLRGSEFVKLGLTGHRWGIGGPRSRREAAAEVAGALATAGATAYGDRAMGSLSGGELQRLTLAQAIASHPKLLLLDEPFSNLDLRNQVAGAQLFARLAAERGIAVLLIAHDVNPLLPLLDQVMYVARGQITLGPPDEVITSARLSALYETQVEVLRDSRGRLFVVGLEEEASHPHAHDDDCHEHGAGHPTGAQEGSLELC